MFAEVFLVLIAAGGIDYGKAAPALPPGVEVTGPMPQSIPAAFTPGFSASLLAADFDIAWYEKLQYVFLDHKRPLICSVLVGAVLGMLGCFVILRRMALIGDAISHAVLPGVVIAFLLVSTGITGLFIGALLAGILTAVGINLVARFSRVKEDTAIGIVFTAMFAAGIILISWLPSGTHFDMKCFLFGDPLAVQKEDLYTVLVITPLVVLTIVALFHPLKLMSFDPVMAQTMGFNTTGLHYLLMIVLSATIVAALRSVGVVMGIAMLITPAAFAYQLTNRLWIMLLIASGAGAFSAFAGMLLAFLIDAPPGPSMVLVATAMFLVAMGFAPQRGAVMTWLRRRQIRAHILEEDVLKALVRAEQRPGDRPAHAPDVAAATSAADMAELNIPAALPHVPPARVQAAVRRLQREGLLLADRGSGPLLTDRGRERALQMVRAHRLWETYLAEQDISDPHLHDEAERLEHAHTLAEQIADDLGQPRRDPHGEPIPPAVR